MKKIRVNNNDNGKRIDNFLSKIFPSFKKSEIYKALRNKKIKVNDKKVDYSYRLVNGDEITLFINEEIVVKKDKNDFYGLSQNFSIVYEDKNILIVNKEAGLIVHEDKTNSRNTLINQIRNYLNSKNEYIPEKENSFAPSLLNRIDRNTSGLVMAAKNKMCLEIMNEKIKNREVDKYYLCWVHGKTNFHQTKFIAYMEKDSSKNMIFVTAKPVNRESKQMISIFTTIKNEKTKSLLEVELVTGRTHQIRAHLSYLKFPIIGERKYSNDHQVKNKEKYQQLISYKIIFNFKSDAGNMNYINNKTIVVPNKEIILM